MESYALPPRAARAVPTGEVPAKFAQLSDSRPHIAIINADPNVTSPWARNLHGAELDGRLESDHPRRTIAAETYFEQADGAAKPHRLPPKFGLGEQHKCCQHDRSQKPGCDV